MKLFKYWAVTTREWHEIHISILGSPNPSRAAFQKLRNVAQYIFCDIYSNESALYMAFNSPYSTFVHYTIRYLPYPFPVNSNPYKTNLILLYAASSIYNFIQKNILFFFCKIRHTSMYAWMASFYEKQRKNLRCSGFEPT